MVFFYVFIFAFFILLGIFRLQDEPAAAIHNFLIALYFFVILYAMIGKPFSRRVHVGLAIALLANAGLQFYTEDILGALISLLFAYFAYNDRDRFKSA